MRYYSTICFLFFATSLVISIEHIISKDVKFPLEVIHDEVSIISRQANFLLLESGLLNENIKPMSLSQQVLEREYNENMLIVYTEASIIKRLEQQKKLSKLIDEVREREAKDDLKKEITNGLNDLKNLERKLTSEIHEAVNGVPQLSTMVKISEPSFVFSKEQRDTIRDAKAWMVDFMEYEEHFESRFPNEVVRMDYTLRTLISTIEAVRDVEKFFKEEGYLDDNSVSLEPVKALKSAIEAVEQNIDRMKTLEALIPKLIEVESFVNILEEFRKIQAPKEVESFIQSLKKDIELLFVEHQESCLLNDIDHNSIQKDTALFYTLQSISKMSSHMSYSERKFNILSNQLSSFEQFLKELEILKGILPNGTLTTTKLQACLQQIDTSIEFSKEKVELEKWMNMDISEALQSYQKFRDMVDRVIKYSDMSDYVNTLKKLQNDGDYEGFRKAIHSFDVIDLKQTKEFIYNDIRYPKKPYNYISPLEKAIYETNDILQQTNMTSLLEMAKRTNDKLKETEKFLSCTSALNLSHSKIKELINAPTKAWNFELKFLESTVDVVDSFQGAYRQLAEFKTLNFKNTSDEATIKKFPLQGEGVKEVSNGVNALGDVLKMQDNLDTMRNWDISNFKDPDIKDKWGSVNSSLSVFMDELSRIEGNLKMTDLPSILPDVPFDLQLDPIIDFINTTYEENGKIELLQVLNEIKHFDFNYSNYPEKVKKMNEEVNKIKNWKNETMDPLNKKEKDIPLCDCYENPSDLSYHTSCNNTITLPIALENDPIKEFIV